jgi:transmembrane 9 superfamily protein 2/4
MSVNKLTSPKVLSSMDFTALPFLSDMVDDKSKSSENTSAWKQGLDSAHGDVVYNLLQDQGEEEERSFYNVRMKQDVYCGQLGVLDLDTSFENTADTAGTAAFSQTAWRDAIRRDFRYNFMVDGMPVALTSENDVYVTTRYWGGVPLGVTDTDTTTATSTANTFVHNHLNFQIMYYPVNTDKGERFRIHRTSIEPFSVQHTIDYGTSTIPATLENPIPSCQINANVDPQQQQQQHTSYDMLMQVQAPPQPTAGKVLFTYDVIWILYTSTPSADARWDVFLSMDDSTPAIVLWMGLLIGVLINGILVGALWTWIMRDLSYKPLIQMDQMEPNTDGNQEEEGYSPEAAQEIQLWPLSSRVFFSPAHAPGVLAVLCGTGAHLATAASMFLFFFQFGIFNQSMGANILTPCVILYTLASFPGGYMTGRLLCIFHWNLKDVCKACFLVATVYPLVGLVTMHIVYDVLPSGSTAPNYNVLSNSILLIAVWLGAVLPITLLGGVLGHRGGDLKNFPVTQGAGGYQDFALQLADENMQDTATKSMMLMSCYRKCRIPMLLLVGGILPVICCFIEYSYAVAGPIYRNYYSEYKFGLASFILFNTCAGLVSMLLYYGQLRVNNYGWWWSSFCTGASAGLYIWILALSWLCFNVAVADVDASSFCIYFLWFAFLSLGVSCVTGLVGVAACVALNRILYANAMRRCDD